MTAIKTYRIAYSHDEHGSDELSADFGSTEAAYREIAMIQKDPGAINWAEWLKDAMLWVVDEDGRFA